MKLRLLLFICCLGFTTFAAAAHNHPKAENTVNSMRPGFCQIEIINNSFDAVTVYGQFDDGATLIPFDIYPFEGPQYISLFYYGYCHRDMYLDLVTFYGYHFYSGYTSVDSTIRIVPYLNKQIKAEIRKK